jgi:competence protein ComEA
MNSHIKDRFVCTILLAAGLVGCTQTQQNPQELKEKTAEETAALKRDAKAVAEGIREGWNREQAVDLNTASKDQLMTLPGLTATEADRLIARRPYHAPDELVTKHVLTRAEYDKIADQVTIKK